MMASIATANGIESSESSILSGVASLDLSPVAMAAAVAAAAVAAAVRNSLLLNFHPVSPFFTLYTWGSSSVSCSCGVSLGMLSFVICLLL